MASELTHLSATELARRIAAGDVSSVEVVQAHIDRILDVDGRLNALVIRRFDHALREARESDEARARGETRGPLDGVPITVKECFHVAGTMSTIGVQNFASSPASVDSPLVTRLRQAGAIVLGKTNLPQLMIMHETDSPVYGRANNPWNLDRSPGGSSGGEAAIIAAGGSPLGLGNDLGGSIRQPAHACGIHGLKPTAHRLPSLGSVTNFRGMEAMLEQAGPLARHVEDLALALRILAAPGLERLDPTAVPVPLGDPGQIAIRGLRIAMWTDDGYFPASPAIQRAVREAGAALADRGAIVEPFHPPDVSQGMHLYIALISADGAQDLRRLLGHSPRDHRVSRLLQIARIPGWLRPGVVGALGWSGQPRLAKVMRMARAQSADGYWRTCFLLRQYVRRFFAALDGGKFDVVICPPHALPALKHGSAEYLTTAASYSMLGNVLGWPAGVVAATRVRPDEQTDRPVSRDRVETNARDVELESSGLPVGVQVAAWHWREDVVLAVMQALEEHFRGQADYPHRPPV